MPGSALVVIESELAFRGLETILNRPPMAFDRDQRFDGCSRWTPGGEEGEVIIGDATTDQKPARPHAALLSRDEDAARVWGFVSAVCPVDIGALDLAAGEPLGVLDDSAQRVPIIRIAGQRLCLQDEMSARRAGIRTRRQTLSRAGVSAEPVLYRHGVWPFFLVFEPRLKIADRGSHCLPCGQRAPDHYFFFFFFA